jgi:hypothetical protein
MQSENPATVAADTRQALEAWVDPWIDRSLGELKAIESVTAASDALRLVVRLPVPVGDGYATELAERLSAQLRSRGLPDRILLDLGSTIRAHAVQ